MTSGGRPRSYSVDERKRATYREGLLLYAFCVTVPTLLSAVARRWQNAERPSWPRWRQPDDATAVTLTTAAMVLARTLIARRAAAAGSAVVASEGALSSLRRCRSEHVLRRDYGVDDKTNTTNKNDTDNRDPSRLAAAAFRSLHSSLACLAGWRWFRRADFWPRALGGRGATSRCWDLHGGLWLVADDDFDDLNAALRAYFLVQVSYQTQSLLLRLSAGELRPAAERALALSLMAGSFLFSGWRRLTAVAVFALDLSGLLLSALQLMLETDVVDASAVRLAHKCLVLPSFVYCRFYVLPFVVGYSAAFESRDWLRHMEYALVPGWGDTVYYLFTGLMALSVVLNLIYFRRLLLHPRLRLT